MCLVCVEWEKKKMTSQEALRALGEMIVGHGESEENIAHYFETSDKIFDKELKEADNSPDLDPYWQRDDD